MKPTIDWTISILAIASLIISLMTLYLSHLRGARTILAKPGKIYSCQNFYVDFAGSPSVEYTVETKLLFQNIGNQPSILFEFNPISHGNEAICHRLKPHPDSSLPVALLPGEDWSTTLSVDIKTTSGSLDEHFSGKECVQLQSTYKTNASFGRIRTKREKINIDLKPLRDDIKKNKYDQPANHPPSPFLIW